MKSKQADNLVSSDADATPAGPDPAGVTTLPDAGFPPPRHVEQLREIAALSQRVQHGLARELEINGTALDAMEVLSREGPLTHGALAERLRVTPGAVTGVINRLEATGHARREHRTDRRTLWVVPAEASLRRAGELMTPLAAELRRRTADYTPEELALVERFLDDVAAAYRAGAESLAGSDEAVPPAAG